MWAGRVHAGLCERAVNIPQDVDMRDEWVLGVRSTETSHVTSKDEGP
jgi:hypothetical protein